MKKETLNKIDELVHMASVHYPSDWFKYDRPIMEKYNGNALLIIHENGVNTLWVDNLSVPNITFCQASISDSDKLYLFIFNYGGMQILNREQVENVFKTLTEE